MMLSQHKNQDCIKKQISTLGFNQICFWHFLACLARASNGRQGGAEKPQRATWLLLQNQSGVLLQVNLSTTTDHHTLPSLVTLVGLVNPVTLDTPVIPVNTPSLVTLVNFKLVGQVLGSE